MKMMPWEKNDHPYTISVEDEEGPSPCKWSDGTWVCHSTLIHGSHKEWKTRYIPLETETVQVGAKRLPPPSNLEEKAEAVTAFRAHADATAVLVREKDKAYGGAWRKQGYMGNLARIMSKAARLESMVWRDDKDGYQLDEFGETVQDTLHDLMALAAFMATNLEEGNRWGH